MSSTLVDGSSIDSSELPQWIESSFRWTDGRDPLGLQSITADRIMPRLVPGVLALSRRARYFSFYPFLLDEVLRERRYATQNDLSTLIKQSEYEYAIAVLLCPRRCGESRAAAAVGTNNAWRKVRDGVELYDRGESVESFLGGYGLYYRTPLVELGLVAQRGEYVPDREEALPRDVLRPGRAEALAHLFRRAIEDTEYYRRYFLSHQPVPHDVLAELSERACLCRLEEYPDEQGAIRAVLLGPPEHRSEIGLIDAERRAAADQRRRSFALLLWAVGRAPGLLTAGDPDSVFRRSVWQAFETPVGSSTALLDVVGQWAGLVAKDYLQDALSCIWTEFCRRGHALQGSDGMRPDELDHFLRVELLKPMSFEIAGRPIELAPDRGTSDFTDQLADVLSGVSLEDVRTWTVGQSTAAAGMLLLVVLRGRVTSEVLANAAWSSIAGQSSNWQTGLLGFVRLFDQHLEESPSLRDTLVWIAERFVIDVHERVAYSKLTDFTFRFRWEEDRLRFYELSHERFRTTDIRLDAITRLSIDLGLLDPDDPERPLTSAGEEFVLEVLG